jgi:radical SAM protein with 4Fe4S-binding SPASM domain
MMRIMDYFKKHKPVPAGLYSGRMTVDGTLFRAHLRIEKEGEGILTLNASRILHLNRVAAEIAYHLINKLTEEETVAIMKSRYRVGALLLKADVNNLYKIVRTLGATDQVCPLSDLGITLKEPYGKSMSAPLRMDIALTYKCQNKCGHCYNEEERKLAELPKEKWFDVIKKCEQAGIPQVVFTGGEPTLVGFLDELVAYGENLGLVTGMNTNGRKLKDIAFAEKLRDSGLDHIQITLESPLEEIHDAMSGEKGAFKETMLGLQNALKTGLFTMTNTTITKMNKDSLKGMPKFLKENGVSTFAVNSIIFSGKGASSGGHLEKEELIRLIEEMAKGARENGMKFIWYTPTKYCEFNPVEMGLGVKQCTAARLSMAVEPNGDVIPCQSYYKSVGNILKDDWPEIWNNELCKKLREPQLPLADCVDCSDLTLCGGGCPLENEKESFTCREINSGG